MGGNCKSPSVDMAFTTKANESVPTESGIEYRVTQPVNHTKRDIFASGQVTLLLLRSMSLAVFLVSTLIRVHVTSLENIHIVCGGYCKNFPADMFAIQKKSQI